MFGLVTFTKVKLHPSSLIMRNAIHQAMTHLIFVPKVGKLGGGNLGKLGGNMSLWSADQLVLWVLYNEKAIWQLFILHVTTLERWHNQYWHSTWFTLKNDPCKTYYWCCPLTQHWMIKELPPITPHWKVENLWFWSLDQHLPQLQFQRFQILWSCFIFTNMLKLLMLKSIG